MIRWCNPYRPLQVGQVLGGVASARVIRRPARRASQGIVPRIYRAARGIVVHISTGRFSSAACYILLTVWPSDCLGWVNDRIGAWVHFDRWAHPPRRCPPATTRSVRRVPGGDTRRVHGRTRFNPGPLRRQGGGEARLEFSLSPAEPVVERASGDVCELCPQSAFPDGCHSPTVFQQFQPYAPVALHVGPEFALPELATSGRIGCSRAARVAMPKAAVNEADRLEARKDEIGCAGKAPNVKPIPEATHVERSTQGELGFRVVRGDARHDA